MEEKKLPKPTLADYKKREEFDELMKTGAFAGKEHMDMLDFMNSKDWGGYPYPENGRYGLKNALGEVMAKPLFDDFKLLSQRDIVKGEKIVTRQNGKWGVLAADGEGTWLVNPEYDFIGYPNNITHVFRDDKWGVLDISKGEYVIEECESVFDNDGFLFCNRIGFYAKDGKYGVIGDWGAHTEPIFDEVEMEPDGNVKVQFKGEWGFIGEDNKFTNNEEEAYYSFEM